MKKEIIGAIHFSPMPGYPEYPGFDTALQNALQDAAAFIDGGATALVIENNYDIPHKERVDEQVVQEMIAIGSALRKKYSVPIGVSVLWNDYEAALRIAKSIRGSFIRVPVFVDTVKTEYGVFTPVAENVTEIRKRMNASQIQIYADIHVKHAEIISTFSIQESARRAIEYGADALIITGKWTGDSPAMDDLIQVRQVVPHAKIICGSGVSSENIKALCAIADGVIVSTSLKDDTTVYHQQNVKPYSVRINKDKVTTLVNSLQ